MEVLAEVLVYQGLVILCCGHPKLFDLAEEEGPHDLLRQLLLVFSC